MNHHTMTPAETQFFISPELLTLLAAFLDPKSLSHLMRTCKHLHSLGAPTLYRDISTTFKPGSKQLFGSVASTLAFARHTSHVRAVAFGLHELVYYYNCVAVFNELQAKATGTSRLGPRWLAPQDPQFCSVPSIPPMTLLTKLDVRLDREESYRSCPYYLPSYHDPRSSMRQLCWMLLVNPNLLDVGVSGLTFKDDRDVRLFTTALSGLTRLTTFELSAVYWKGDRMHLGEAIVFCCPPTLSVLRMSLKEYELWEDLTITSLYRYEAPGCLQPWEWDDQGCDLPTTPVRNEKVLSNLRVLVFKEMDEVLSEMELRAITDHCPNVHALMIPTVGEVNETRLLAEHIASSCSQLTNLSHQVNPESMQLFELMLHVMEALPEGQVVGLFFRDGRSFEVQGLDAAGIFLRHSQTLVYIHLNGCRNANGEALQVLLTECEALEILEAPWLGDCDLLCIHLDDAIEYDWVCTKMRKLTITVGIPDSPLFRRRDDMGAYYSRPQSFAFSSEEKEQLSSLEQLYEQIGRLTDLEMLSVKAFFYDVNKFWPTASDYKVNAFPGLMSVGDRRRGRPGYLRHLKGLSKLKQLTGSVYADTRETRRTMGWMEATWINEYWPELEEAEFFSPKSHVSEPFVWLQDQRPAGQELYLVVDS
ncbi:MAG: hypothetical protein J3R72DRAFT_180699 [Linnemannia gamsii]|nr:MAG: hypothetical protein J3R72DRAFT_180699 [Linnemannia gamsii]